MRGRGQWVRRESSVRTTHAGCEVLYGSEVMLSRRRWSSGSRAQRGVQVGDAGL